jgi:hypothetical protein
LIEYLEEVGPKKQPSFYSKKVLVGALGVGFNIFHRKEDAYYPSAKSYADYLSRQTGHFCEKIDKKLKQKMT